MPEPTPPNLEEQFVSETVPVGLPWRLLIFSIIIFGLSFSVYLGLRFGYTTYLESRSETIGKRIEELTNQVSQEDQQDFINFYSQLINLQKVLDQHGFSANLFGFLERNTLSRIFYTEANFTEDGSSLVLRGQSDASEVLIDQLNIFEKAPEVEKVILDQMNFEPVSKTVSFSVVISFKKDFFTKPKQ